jgi:hypothetical protein
VFQTFVSSVSSVFFCMMQLLHIDVSKVERVLHMGYVWEAAGDMTTFGAAWAMSRRRRPAARALACGSDVLVLAHSLCLSFNMDFRFI